MNINKNLVIKSFIVLTIFILLYSFFQAFDKFTWLLEVFPIIIAFPILVITYKKFQFSNLVYSLLITHFIILAIGGVYTYAKVPLGFWMQDWFGFTRNNYDKIGHFAQGFIPAIVIRELLLRKSPLKTGKWLIFIVISICLAISAFYELIEWWTAVAQGASAEAFLGTQGYEWDAQSDMLFALIGSFFALIFLSKIHNNSIKKVV